MTRVHYLEKAPSLPRWRKMPPLSGPTLLIYDAILDDNPRFRRWRGSFIVSLPLEAGEELKTLGVFATVLEGTLLPAVRGFGRDEICLVGAGGGSIGDFCGFAASVLKRGVRLVHVPTTWLAAMDSAHGGKTALNVGGFKNQIGTFYPASDVLAIREFLKGQDEITRLSALGELYKAAVIGGGGFFETLAAERDPVAERTLWRLLPEAVRIKSRLVARDPFEIKGERHKLNLGHTLGHALESELGLPHGQAVAWGCRFATIWSERRRLASPSSAARLRAVWDRVFADLPGLAELSGFPFTTDALEQSLRADKKSTGGGKVRFIFPRGPGRVAVETVTVRQILDEARRQGWLA